MNNKKNTKPDHSQSTLVFFVNGKKIEDNCIEPEWTLLYYLRDKLRLCGTKQSCSEGGCGACTVMISKYNRQQNYVEHIAVYACLRPICSVHGLAVTTTEGIGSTKTRLHSTQELIAKAHGTQCGYCTPGFVMSMYALLRNNPRPSMREIDIAFKGNLCRCTGYRPILEGYKTFTDEWQREHGFICGMGDECCRNKSKLSNGDNSVDNTLLSINKFTPYDPSQEPIFPPELKLNSEYDTQELYFKGKNVQWLRPNKLEDLLTIKQNNPDCKIIVGYSETGVESRINRIIYPTLVYPTNIPEMTSITEMDMGIRFGASVTIKNVELTLKKQMKSKPSEQTRLFGSIIDMLNNFGGTQIRNVAAVGGNIMTNSSISDLVTIFTAANCILEVCSKERGYKKLCMNSEFFTGYRKNLVEKDEVLIAINIPLTTENQYFYAYKQGKRHDDDVAIVNCAVNVTFQPNTIIITNIKVAYGGIATSTIMAKNTQKILIGKPWTEETLELAYQELIKDLPISPEAPRKNVHYKRILTLSLFFRAYLAITQQLNLKGYDVTITNSYYSGIEGFQYKMPYSSQYFTVPEISDKNNCIGQPIQHVAAFKQSSGEALYCDDLPETRNELYMGLVLSTEAHAEIISIDDSEALKMNGVHAFFCAKDLTPEQNQLKSILDEEVFISKKVTAKGQVLGAVIADNKKIAQMAAKTIKVQYKKLFPIIISIEQAIEYQSFFNEEPIRIVKGNVDEAFNNSNYVIEGECRTGAQEHFYLETNSVIVNPTVKDDEIYINCSTQRPQQISDLVAEVLQIPINRITTKISRIGGGFGGKESRSLLIALPAAFAAHKLGKPIRCMLDRDEDMKISGTRHPFLFRYQISFTKEGKITGCKIKIYNNAGYSSDLSRGVLVRSLLHFENAYKIPNVEVLGWMCKTNLPSNTAFRGFGGPQGMFAGETMIRDIAEYLNKDILEIQELNLYNEGDYTHYNQKLEYCTLKRCWDECLTMAEYHKRKKEIEKFNRENRWKKRGISVIPSKHGIAFIFIVLNQGGALLHIYTDGSVLLSHGGVEMGQGLHTKMIQVASKCLNIPIDNIFISESATDKIPNASPSAGSSGSDLYGMAIKNACEKIMKRLEPYKAKNPTGKWEEWVRAAYMDRVSLSATGFYTTPNIGYDFKTNSGNAFSYFTYGVACTEVEIDCLTGDHQVLNTNIVMDLGQSLNPAIDVGQIEGAFIQGYGMFTMEEMMYSYNGDIITKGLQSYILPGFSNIPIEFNVSLLKGSSNPRAIFSSKAVGEPPLFLASSVLFAIKEAIKSARKDANIDEHFTLNAPATSAKIRTLCEDHIISKIEIPDPSTYTQWNVIP